MNLRIQQAFDSARNISRRNITFSYSEGAWLPPENDVVYNEPKNVQELLRGPSAPKKQEKPTNPNANHMKDKKQKHVKRSVCKVWSIKWEVWSVEWKAWSGKCRVPSVACQVRSECGVSVCKI